MKKVTLLFASAILAQTAFAANEGLTFDVYNAGPSSFSVNSTIISGETEVLVVDTGFTKTDALRIATKVLESQKELKTIFISQADPDYYFGAEVLHQLFPNAQIITTSAVKKVIEEKLEQKLKLWVPRMGTNAPETPIVPEAYTKDAIMIDGYKIEIRGTEGELSHRPYLWAPEQKTILGNVAVFGNVHLWMADTQTDASQAAWGNQLQEMLSLKPDVVIPGHMATGTKMDASAIQYSIDYLNDFQHAKENSSDSKELIELISKKYPNGEKSIVLSIGAKVHKGEMKW